MEYFSLSDSGNGSVLAVTWDGGTRLENLLKVFPKKHPQTILFDPLLPENAGVLTEPNIHHSSAIPALRSGEAELLLYSLSGLSSLQPTSTALMSIFPGLREAGRKAVSLIGPKELSDIAADLPKPLRLVIDTPGSELEVLDAIEQAGLLKSVAAIQLRCGVEPFFEGAADDSKILSWLEERSFRVSEKDESDADWPEFLLLRDPQAKQVEDLTSKLETALKDRDVALAGQEKIGKYEAELKDREKSIQALRDEMVRLRETSTAAGEHAARAEIDRDQARKDLGVALHNAAAIRQDYNDLRDKYSSLLSEKNDLEQLIQQLTPRLQEAAEHLRHFSDPAMETTKLKKTEKGKTIRRKPGKRTSGTVT